MTSVTKIFQNLFKENNSLPDDKKGAEEIVAKNNVIPIIYDDNLQTIRFENSEISLSNSEYLILKNLIGKNGELLLYEDIEKILNNKVNLKINVKYKKDWSTKKEHYEDIGLNF